MLWLSVQLLCETFLNLERTQPDMINNIYWSSRTIYIGLHVQYILVFVCNIRYSRLILTKLQYSRQIFEKNPKCQISLKNASSGSRVVPWERAEGRTDRRTDMTKLTVDFRNFANPPKITVLQKRDDHCNDVARFVWCPVRVIAMATAKRNY